MSKRVRSGQQSQLRRRLTFIDDNPKGLKNLIDGVRDRWDVSIIEETSGWNQFIVDLRNTTFARPAVISVDLGLPNDPDGASVGLELLARLRSADSTIPIVVHSIQHKVSPAVLRAILKNKASYLRTREDSQLEWYSQLLPAIAAGYLVCCRSQITSLSRIVDSNNLLSPLDWEITRRVALGENHEQIADDLNIKVRRFQSELTRIATDLINRKLISMAPPNRATSGHIYREPFRVFYESHQELRTDSPSEIAARPDYRG